MIYNFVGDNFISTFNNVFIINYPYQIFNFKIYLFKNLIKLLFNNNIINIKKLKFFLIKVE